MCVVGYLFSANKVVFAKQGNAFLSSVCLMSHQIDFHQQLCLFNNKHNIPCPTTSSVFFC